MFKLVQNISRGMRIPLTLALVLLIQVAVFPSENALSEFSVHQLHFKNQKTPISYSNIGIFTLNYIPEENASFVNIVAKNKDNTGNFWLVRNLYLPNATFIATPQTITVPFDWNDLGYTEGEAVTSVEVGKATSPTIISGMPIVSDFTEVTVDTLTEDAAGDDTAIPAEMPRLTSGNFYPSFTAGDDISMVEYRGCSVPNLDLNHAIYRESAIWTGDWMACGPASAANSLKWLAEENSGISLPKEHRLVLMELSALMGRTANSGVTIEKFIQGKLDFVAQNNLPINIKFQSQTLTGDVSSTNAESWAHDEKGEAKYPTWEWLTAQIKAGGAVEVMYFWWDGEKWRGHAVVVTGVEETTHGLKTIKFIHDLRQSMAGGTLQECENVIIDAEDRMVLRPREAYIAHAVAESPGTPFPVEMGLFDAEIQGNNVHFVWQTVSETNNYGFEIQKNSTKIGFVPGNGTTAQPQNYAFTDYRVGNGKFSYQLIQIDFDGARNLAGTREVVVETTPGDFVLAQNYPNPFNPSTTISYSIPRKGLVKLAIFNILGNEIRTLVAEEMPAGTHQFQFDGRDLVSGVYYYKLEAGEFSEMKKFIILK